MQTHFFTKGQGHSTSLIKNNNEDKENILEKNTTEWRADYDGDKAHIDFKTDKNGKRRQKSRNN
jgi:hypothetical protein